MAITLSPQTEALIESRMKEFGCADADELIRMSLQIMPVGEEFDYDDLDDETRAAIERAELQPDISADEVRRRLTTRSRTKRKSL